MLPNTPYFVVLYFAVLKAGGVVVCFNPLLAEREIEQQIADSGVEIMATLDLSALFGKLARVLERRPGPPCRRLPDELHPADRRSGSCSASCGAGRWPRCPTDERHVWFEQLIVNDGRFDTPVCEPERTVAMLQYTGGTTGTPKGAELTHANLYVNAVQIGRWFHAGRPGQERILGVLPLFHIFGMATVMNVGLLLGAELILLPRFEIEQLMQTIHRKRPTIFPAVPTLFAAINRYEARQPLRPVLDRDLRVGRRSAAGRGQGQLRAADRLRHRRGLRADRGVAGRVHQPGARACARPARSACRCRSPRSTSSRWKTAPPRSRRASAASCACAGRR